MDDKTVHAVPVAAIWEYRAESWIDSHKEIERKLKEAGQMGWELVSLILDIHSSGYLVIFKRAAGRSHQLI